MGWENKGESGKPPPPPLCFLLLLSLTGGNMFEKKLRGINHRLV